MNGELRGSHGADAVSASRATTRIGSRSLTIADFRFEIADLSTQFPICNLKSTI
jgi:hypothetical protein